MLSPAKHPSDSEILHTQETDFYTEVAEIGRRAQSSASEQSEIWQFVAEFTETMPERTESWSEGQLYHAEPSEASIRPSVSVFSLSAFRPSAASLNNR
jgi:hypothetical protein